MLGASKINEVTMIVENQSHSDSRVFYRGLRGEYSVREWLPGTEYHKTGKQTAAGQRRPQCCSALLRLLQGLSGTRDTTLCEISAPIQFDTKPVSRSWICDQEVSNAHGILIIFELVRTPTLFSKCARLAGSQGDNRRISSTKV